jgi:segregation and condensation protein B
MSLGEDKRMAHWEEDLEPGLFAPAGDEEAPEEPVEDPEAGQPQLEDGRDQLEVLVFAAEEPLDTVRLATLLEWEPARVEEAVERLNQDYLEQGRSFELRRLAGGWQMVARRRHAPLLARLLKESVRPRLSRAALETLAVVAFRQPVTKGEIEAVRGVKADAVLRTLLERNLVVIAGRSDGVGRPLLYRTTREFLEAFGLASLQELPRLKEIQAWLKGRERSAEELPPLLLRPLSPPEPAAAGDEEDGGPPPEAAPSQTDEAEKESR